MDLDTFRLIGDWYHFALRSLVETNPELTPKEAAKRLGISSIEAEMAIERLTRLKLLQVDKSGALRKTEEQLLFRSEENVEALNRYQRTLLEKASTSLETQPRNSRHVGSETFSIDPALIPKAKQIIERFYREISELAGSSDNPTDVYAVAVQFFNLTPSKEGSLKGNLK